MAIDKLTPRYLNFEDDERLVKRVEMTDAVNVRIDSDDDGDAGVIKNVVGNTQVSLLGDTLPAGNNKVIGSVHNNVKGEILFFVHNSANNHRIYKYDDNLEKVITVYKNEATGTVASASADTLGFKATDYVDAAVLVDKDGDTLLYFTNGRGEPKKINVDKAIRGDYPDGYEAVEAYISLIKKPPLEPPTFVFNSDADIKTNRFLGRQFQFACQYVYEDGEVSAISPITEITKSPNHQNLGSVSTDSLQSVDNKVVITCKRTNSDIKKIRFLAREGNAGVFFIIKDVDTQFSSDSNSTVSVEFSNEKAYTPISNDENNKQFDAVGEDVKSITISGNRIFLGNYKEGFDLNDKGSISLNPNYHPLANVIEVNQPEDVTSSSKAAFTNGMYTGHNYLGSFNHTFTGFGGKISMLTKLDLDAAGFDSNSDFNSYQSFDLSVTFSNIRAQYLGYQSLGGFGDVGKKGLLAEVSPLKLNVRTNLSGDYSSITEVRDAIVNDINNLDDFELGVSPKASGNPDNGAGYSGVITVKVHALSTITYRQAHLTGSNCITLFLEPKTISVSNPAPNAKSPIVRTFSDGVSLNNYGLLDSMENGGNSRAGFPDINRVHQSCIFLGVNCNAVGFFNQFDTTMSFKAGANHAFGIVYQDKNGRLSTVRPIGEKNVEWFDSSLRDGNAGKTSMVVRIPSTDTPPENAVRWMPVYAGNTDVGNFIQYTVNDAFSVVATANKNIPVGVDVTQRLYVSARGFEGKENSYIDTFDPEISYSYAKGDVMKIVSVDEERGTSKEFRVVGYENLGETDNPITTASSFDNEDGFEKTGYFFVIQKPTNESEFNSDSDTQFREKCLVEIRSPKFSTENQVYYQIGKSYDIQNGVHKGEDRNQYLTYISLNGDDGIYRLETTNKLFVGDVVAVSGISPNEFVVKSVAKRGDRYESVVTSLNTSELNITPDTYTSDFSSASVDGFSALSIANNSVSSVASVTDDFGTVVNNVLQLNCTDTVSENHLLRKQNPLPIAGSIAGKNLLCSFKMLVDGGNTGLVSACLSDGRTTSLGIVEEGKVVEKGRWKTFTDIPFTQVASQSRLIFLGLDSSDNPSFSAGTNDKFYIADVVLQEADLSVINVDDDAVIELDNGDVYFRKRLLNYGFSDGTTNTSLTYVDYVEDYRFTDFISTVSNDFGKPNAYSEDAGRIHRNSSITYSDAYVMDSDRLSLSSFNNSLANFLDIKNKYGAIQRMVDIEDAFYAVQEHKVTLFPVNRNVIQTAGGDASVTLSTDVVNLNSSKSFAGDYGCGNDPEAVVYYEGVLYFVDRKANKVFSISSSGIREISDIFADSYIADKLSGADKGGEYNIYSGIDPNNDEYLLSTRTIVNKTISVDQGSLYVLPANSGDSVLSDFTPHSVNSTTFGSFNLLNFNFEDVDVNFEDMGNGVLYVDDGFSDNAMQLDTPVDNLTSGTSNIVYTDKDNTFLGVAQVDNTNKFVTIV